MTKSDHINIESRLQLFNTLAEAAELEHSLLCCYLYAIFSLKNSVVEDISEDELKSINRWREIILSVAFEEMSHLALVANLMSSIGGSPHFMRPNFPSPLGSYPADLVINLSPFDLETIKHFVYLERPADHQMKDSKEFDHPKYTRESPEGMLMPYFGDYETVGELYRTVEHSIEKLAKELGEEKLFCGNPALQIGFDDLKLEGLSKITDLKTAQKALDTIVSQGEGARVNDNSHFSRFISIQEEYEKILLLNPDFKPARPAAKNPVMRRPPTPEGKVWCNAPLTSIHMDLANAVYIAAIRALVQVYENPNRDKYSKSALLDASFSLMHAMTPLGESLSYLPANKDTSGINAGMSFAMVRSLAPIQDQSEHIVLLERLDHIISSYEHLVKETKDSLEKNINGVTSGGLEKLTKTEKFLKQAIQAIKKLK